MKLDVVFVCQQGDLEVMASLLAASLRQFCGQQVNLHAIEPIPAAEYGTVSPLTRKFLDGLDVKWHPFRNPISDEYKIFNKLNAFNIQPHEEKILFLDSDVFIRRPFLPAMSAYYKRPFAAKSAGKQRFWDWEAVYRLFDLPVPRMRWPATASHEWGPPYFNAGVILVDAAVDFSKHWIDTCLQIHQDDRIKIENRGTVQLGLPVVLYRRNLPYALLDNRLHFGLSKNRHKTRRPWPDDHADIVHYFKASNLSEDPGILHEIGQLVRNFELQEIFSLTPSWQKLLRSLERWQASATSLDVPRRPTSLFAPRATKPEVPSPKPAPAKPATPPASFSLESRMVFIAGIPHSGAGLFSALLAELPGVRVVDERVTEKALKSFARLDQLGEIWQQWRKDFNSSRLEMDQDDSAPNRHRSTMNGVRESNEVLATTSAWYYLSWLPQLLEAFPQATVFLLVRHPFATIASWMNSSDLSEARFIDEDTHAGIRGTFLSEEQCRHLAELRGVDDPAMKRAGLWEYFSGLAGTHAEQVHIFRYEDLLEAPAALLRHAYQSLFPGADFDPAIPRLPDRDGASNEKLAEWDKECIRTICNNHAGLFGYNLYES